MNRMINDGDRKIEVIAQFAEILFNKGTFSKRIEKT